MKKLSRSSQADTPSVRRTAQVTRNWSARTRSRPTGRNGSGLEEQPRQRRGRPHHHQRHRRRMETEPHPMGHGLLRHAFGYEWELVKSPAGAQQWQAKNCKPEHMIPDAHDPSKKHAPMMTTADLSLRFDPIYEPIARRFHQNPEALPMPSPAPGSN
jgi:catalase (peroxidase I)